MYFKLSENFIMKVPFQKFQKTYSEKLPGQVIWKFP